jgi:glycosyltransferase involved in cell wall biosynthesis
MQGAAAGAMNQPPRLLIVVNDLGFFLSHRLPIALGARTAGYDVHVATPDNRDRDRLEAHGLRFHPVPIDRSGGHPLREVASFRALLGLYRRLRPSVVHHVTHKPILYGSLAARLAGVPGIVNAVSGLGYAFVATGSKAALRRRLMLLGYRMAFSREGTHGIFQNREDIELFRAAGVLRDDQYSLIPGSGVDLHAFSPTPAPSGIPIIVLAARMIWDKGVGDFVEAVRLLRQRGTAFRAVLVGGPDPANPRSIPAERLKALAAEGVTEWWGLRGDMPAVLSQASIVCLPSVYREGVPKVLLEAAAAGRALVATDVPGCRDVVRSGVNGLLVPPRDPAALADALGVLVHDPALRSAMGRRSREIAEREYSVEAVVTETLGIYRRLLSQAEPSHA